MHILQAVGGRNHTYQEKEKKQHPADVATDKQGRLKLHYCISTSMHILLKMFVTLL